VGDLKDCGGDHYAYEACRCLSVKMLKVGARDDSSTWMWLLETDCFWQNAIYIGQPVPNKVLISELV
jgi:hypothetical protein